MAVLRLKVEDEPLMTVTRAGIYKEKLVYVIIANKKLKYQKGKSRIAYIGTTKNGIGRVAQSAANWAGYLLEDHGVTRIDLHVVTCTPLQGVKTWRELERVMILQFRDMYGEIPTCNTQGKNLQDSGYTYFSVTRIDNIIKNLGDDT